MKHWCVAVVLCVAACSALEDLPWWKTAIFYQVYPRSFKDSDGDGIGDLKGIAQMAGYFKEIGVDAIWLSPIFTSPMADFGYDVSDYTDIDPMFGTMGDFKRLLKAYEDAGVKVVVDFVPNHSSDKHIWFQKSIQREDPYPDYYIWVNGTYDETTGKHIPPNNWMSVFSGSTWEWNDQRQQFYFHDFLAQQPDLNYRNPAVKAKMEEVIRFWLDMGVDGFRLDSANYMLETSDLSQNEQPLPGTDGSEWKDYNHTCTQNQPGTYDLLKEWAEIFYEYSVMPNGKPRALFIEAYTDLEHTLMYYGQGNTSLMQPFNFKLLVYGDQSTNAGRLKQLMDQWLDNMPEGDVANWVVGNHDNGRVADRYGHAMVDAVNLMTGVLPGIKVTYYGSEIGMQDTFVRWEETVDPSGKVLGPGSYYLASRDPERTPMQWDTSISAGFSTNSTPWLPVNPNYYWLNVEAQRTANTSHLKVFQAMAKARKDPVLQRGDYNIEAPDNDTLVIIRSFNESYYVLLINMGSKVRSFTTENLFYAYNIDMDLEVVTASLNYDNHMVGDVLRGGSLYVSMRPKSALLLKSYTDSGPSSSATRLLLPLPLLMVAVLAVFHR